MVKLLMLLTEKTFDERTETVTDPVVIAAGGQKYLYTINKNTKKKRECKSERGEKERGRGRREEIVCDTQCQWFC